MDWVVDEERRRRPLSRLVSLGGLGKAGRPLAPQLTSHGRTVFTIKRNRVLGGARNMIRAIGENSTEPLNSRAEHTCPQSLPRPLQTMAVSPVQCA